MRHNLIIVLLLLGLFGPLFGEKPRTEKEQTRKPAETPRRDRRIDEIDRTWMQTIHGNKPQTENSDSATNEKPSGDTPDRMLNPGPEGADRTAPSESAKAEASTDAKPDTQTPSAPQSLFPEEDRPSFVSTLVRFLGMFALMVGAFYGVMRYLKSKSVGGSMGDLATTLGSVALAPGKHLQVVDLAGKILVLGVSDAGVQLVTEVEDARTAERIRIWHSSKPVIPTPENLLQKAMLALKGSDLKFWNKREPQTPSFREHLNTVIPRSRASREEMLAGTMQSDRATSDAFQMDQGETAGLDRTSAAPTQKDLFQTEDDLRSLIRDQKNRLAKLKDAPLRKRREPTELAPET